MAGLWERTAVCRWGREVASRWDQAVAYQWGREAASRWDQVVAYQWGRVVACLWGQEAVCPKMVYTGAGATHEIFLACRALT